MRGADRKPGSTFHNDGVGRRLKVQVGPQLFDLSKTDLTITVTAGMQVWVEDLPADPGSAGAAGTYTIHWQ